MFREKVVDVLTEKLRHVVQAMNRQQYLPHTPPQAELDLVFDTSFPDVQPYLFKVRIAAARVVGAHTRSERATTV